MRLSWEAVLLFASLASCCSYLLISLNIVELFCGFNTALLCNGRFYFRYFCLLIVRAQARPSIDTPHGYVSILLQARYIYHLLIL